MVFGVVFVEFESVSFPGDGTSSLSFTENFLIVFSKGPKSTSKTDQGTAKELLHK